MSLKWFHLVFIAACVVLAVIGAAWAIRNGHWIVALVVLAGGTALIAYRDAFLRKTSGISQ
ncbi:MAG: hypothetical protein ACM3SQ_16740 [Betaproteobacteria bacterium]